MNKEETLRILDKPVLPVFSDLLLRIQDLIRESSYVESDFLSEDGRSGRYFGNLYRMRKERLIQNSKSIPLGMEESITVFLDNIDRIFLGRYVRFDSNVAFIFINESGWISAMLLFNENKIDS